MNKDHNNGEEAKRAEAAHDENERHPNWGDDNRQVNPQHEEKRSEDRQESQEKFEKHNAESAGKSGSTHPDHKKDTQSTLSEDPTRKNEANQGASDLRKRERTSFRREGEKDEGDTEL